MDASLIGAAAGDGARIHAVPGGESPQNPFFFSVCRERPEMRRGPNSFRAANGVRTPVKAAERFRFEDCREQLPGAEKGLRQIGALPVRPNGLHEARDRVLVPRFERERRKAFGIGKIFPSRLPKLALLRKTARENLPKSRLF